MGEIHALCWLWIGTLLGGAVSNFTTNFTTNYTTTKPTPQPLPPQPTIPQHLNSSHGQSTEYSNNTDGNSTITRPHPSWREIARNKSKLVKSLLSNYDKRIRPFTGVFPLEVRVDMFISNIWAIEEAKMDYTMDIYLRQYWRDPRLTFDGSILNKEVLTLNRQTIDEIWIPSTYFFNAKKAYFHDVTTENYLLMIQPNGDVFYSVRLTITMACKLTLQQFPHDVQKCEMAVESYGYQATDVYYRWNSRNSTGDVVYISEDLEMPQFKITNVELEEKTNIYNIGPHSALAARFTFHRRLGYYMIQTYIPSMLTVTISWFSFWISPDSPPARVGLGITTVLTMITISNSARAPLPKVSYTKAIDWFLLMCLVYVFGALMEYAIVNFYACEVQKKKQDRINRLSNRMRKELMNFSLGNEESDSNDEEMALHDDNEDSKKEDGQLPFRAMTAVVIDGKNPFLRSSDLYKRNSRPKMAKTKEVSSFTSENETTANGQAKPPYYVWDPYGQAAFLSSERAYCIDKYARIGFPVTFAILTSVYWIVYAPDRIIF